MEQCYNVGDSIATLQGFSGRTSSIRIYGRAVVTVWDDANFRGHTTVFSQSVPDLGQVRLESKSWSDRISSLQVAAEGGGGFGRPGILVRYRTRSVILHTSTAVERGRLCL